MISLSLSEIAEATGGKIVQGNPGRDYSNLVIDSRNAKPGDIFVAIVGENNDGHDFIPEALNNGAELIIASRSINPEAGESILQVKDTTQALQDLASYHRGLMEDVTVIGVTGSAGKTTTRDILYNVLGEDFRAYKSPENYNNEYGLPLTLLGLNGDEDVLVLEMGARNLGDIELLAEIARPHMGILTNIGAAHLENFGSLEKVTRAKSELLENLEGSGTGILNYDDENIRQLSGKFDDTSMIFYSLEDNNADYYADDVEVYPSGKKSEFKVREKSTGEKKRMVMNRSGKHNVYNALSAVAAARKLDMDWGSIQKGLLNIEVTELRQEIREFRGATIINDAYNANPLSMRAALNYLTSLEGDRNIAVLGAMLELGGFERVAHLDLGEYIEELDLDMLITLGRKARTIAEGAKNSGMNRENIYTFQDKENISVFLEDTIKSGDNILVKGSRSLKMEEIVELLLEQGE